MLAAAVAGALLLGVVTGTQDYLAGVTAGFRVTLGRAVLYQSTAALAWVLVGSGVVWLARRWPVGRERWLGALVRHAAAALVAGLLVNAILGAVWQLVGGSPARGHLAGGAGVWESILADTLVHAHLNALVYAAIVAAVQGSAAYVRARLRRAGEDGVPGPSAPAAPEPPSPPAAYASRIPVRRRDTLVLVSVDDVDWVEAADDYACLHARGRRYLADERLHALERTLDPARFVRVHRSALVNLGRVREVVEQRWGDAVAVLHDGTRVRVSRTRRGALMRGLGRGTR
ncbi:MAG TPA: LytTR family DNA-binding domain-containing protein [Gemmatimonadaceae bacterium]|nr:LytTR family DNA-binding domain-containing protein [Gemmatimonadaceae bacterium]